MRTHACAIIGAREVTYATRQRAFTENYPIIGFHKAQLWLHAILTGVK